MNSLDNLIKQVVDLDKNKRVDLAKLEEEKSKLSGFFREERKRIEAEYRADAEEKISKRTAEINNEIEAAKIKAKADYERKMKELEDTYAQKKDEWIESFYEYCIDFDK